MEDRYGRLNRQYGSGVWRSLTDGDFEEEEIWDVLTDKKSSVPNYELSSASIQRNLSTSAEQKLIPRSSSSENKVQQQSAPANIPDWSKRSISSSRSRKESSKHIDDYNNNDDDDDDGELEDDHDGGDSDDDDMRMVPPHVFLARRLARSQISSFSVFEGAGRTLKGRDLSKVRNAVLTKTGFLESL